VHEDDRAYRKQQDKQKERRKFKLLELSSKHDDRKDYRNYSCDDGKGTPESTWNRLGGQFRTQWANGTHGIYRGGYAFRADSTRTYGV